jgi:hypothetical protein
MQQMNGFYINRVESALSECEISENFVSYFELLK